MFREDPVFGILERRGKVRIEVLQNVYRETLLKMMIKMRNLALMSGLIRERKEPCRKRR